MPDQPDDLAESLTVLGGQLAAVRETLALTIATQGRRNVTQRRLITLASGGAALATSVAVVVLVLLIGAIGNLRDQQDTLDTKVTADCAFHRELAGLPGLVLSSATPPPGIAPTVGPVTSALGRESANAYRLAGCPEVLGPLPAPTSTPPGRSRD